MHQHAPVSGGRKRALAIRIACPRPILLERIRQRVEGMRKVGLVGEVQQKSDWSFAETTGRSVAGAVIVRLQLGPARQNY